MTLVIMTFANVSRGKTSFCMIINEAADPFEGTCVENLQLELINSVSDASRLNLVGTRAHNHAFIHSHLHMNK